MRKVRFELPQKSKQGNGSDYLEQLEDSAYELYGIRKSDEDFEFLSALSQRVTFKRLATIFFISFLLAIGSHAPIFMILYQPQRYARCYIAELENLFSYDQILNISVRDYDPRKIHYCSYDRRNYTALVEKHENKYDKIMEEVKSSGSVSPITCSRLSTKPMEGKEDDGAHETISDYFNLYCVSPITKQLVEIILQYGQFALSVPIGILADYKGRRLAGLWSGGLFSIGLCMIGLSEIPTIIIGKFLLGSFMIFYYTVFVIYIENTTSNSRRVAAWLLHFGLSISKFIQWLLYKYCQRWRTINIINVVGCILLPILLVFSKESPRYLYFVGHKMSAYAILRIDRPRLLDVDDKTDGMLNHLKNYWKPVFRKRITVQFLMVFCASSVIYLDRNKFSRVITDTTLLGIINSGFSMGFTTIMTFFLMFVVRRIPIYILYFSISFFISLILFLNPESISIFAQIALMVQLSLMENLVFFTFYCISELYPNEFRLTTYGILCCVTGLSEICNFHLGSYTIAQKSLQYLPLFILSGFCLSVTHCLRAETKDYLIPDYSKEALRKNDYEDILESLIHTR